MAKNLLFAVIVMSTLANCVQRTAESTVQLRQLNANEKKEDLDQLVSMVEAFYGPLKFKEDRFKLNLASLKKSAELDLKKSKTDNDVYAVYAKFLSHFRDGHINFSLPPQANEVMRNVIPIVLAEVEGKALIAGLTSFPEAKDLQVGDEILSIDGMQPIKDIVPIAKKYYSFGNDESDKQLVFRSFIRDTYVRELEPKAPTARIKVKQKNQKVLDLEIPWQKTTGFGSISKQKTSTIERLTSGFEMANSSEIKEFTKASVNEMGASKPFFINQKNLDQFSMKKIQPKKESLQKFGGPNASSADVFAATYPWKGKTIFLIRQASYSVDDHSDFISTYKALLHENKDSADVLIVDQTNNPGGSSDYLESFFKLFAKPNSNYFVQKNRADRKWINSFLEIATELSQGSQPDLARIAQAKENGKRMEESNDKKQHLGPFMNFEAKPSTIHPHSDVSWTKPILVLTNELAGSCGDIFPMLMKENKRAKIFGNRTMGLGGNVEEVGTLNFSGAKIRLTRGLFAMFKPQGNYVESDFVENNGIIPDIPRKITFSDWNSEFKDYINDFSDAALAQLSQSN